MEHLNCFTCIYISHCDYTSTKQCLTLIVMKKILEEKKEKKLKNEIEKSDETMPINQR